MSTYAIGDLQGCLEPLQRLLDQVNFDPASDRLWLAGDLVNRGPSSLETLRFLYDMRHRVTAVLGNHDLHFLAVAFGHQRKGGLDTLEGLLEAEDCHDLIAWLCQCELLHRDTDLGFTMVHAGIPPIWNMEEAEAHAREVEAVLRSKQLDGFLSQMYGNKPKRWKDTLTGVDRLRIITNCFTRMRFCTAEGELDLESKSNVAEQPPGFAPWFAHSEHRCRQHKIVFGHWAALEGKAEAPNVYALDTGCVWGGSLTALRLEDERIFRCQCH